MDIERFLATHCGSVILRQKPAALFSARIACLDTDAPRRILTHHRLSHKALCRRGENALLLVYDRALLGVALRDPIARQALQGLGYPAGERIDAALDHLRARFDTVGRFPHEIGFFLGYPPGDVLGFIRHGGKDCKYCDLWKVYEDVPRAKAMCAAYRAGRQYVLHHLERGGSLYNLPVYACAGLYSAQAKSMERGTCHG